MTPSSLFSNPTTLRSSGSWCNGESYCETKGEKNVAVCLSDRNLKSHMALHSDVVHISVPSDNLVKRPALLALSDSLQIS